MNMKTVALLLLLCTPSISKSHAKQEKNNYSNPDNELKEAHDAWLATPEQKAVDFGSQVFVKSRCSHKEPYGESQECQDLLNALKCFDAFSKSTPQYKKYSELRELCQDKEENRELGDRFPSPFGYSR